MTDITEDFLSWRIERRLKWTEKYEKVIVFRPRFGKSRFGIKVANMVGLTDYRIRLDKIGSLVWKHCDGNTSVQQIVEALRAHFGDEVEPVDKRLRVFLTQMQRSKMIEILKEALDQSSGNEGDPVESATLDPPDQPVD